MSLSEPASVLGTNYSELYSVKLSPKRKCGSKRENSNLEIRFRHMSYHMFSYNLFNVKNTHNTHSPVGAVVVKG